MAFLTPLFLLFGLLAGPIILLYMLRLRRREVLVSSTLLWRKLLRDREANAPWQRLRRNLLLLVQLLILAALVLALARPFVPVPSVATGNVVVLLDGSASMQATDVAPSRFAVAQDEVATLIRRLRGDDQMTLILVTHTPTVLAAATTDRTALQAALAAAQPGSGPANWPAALALAAGAAQGFADAQVVLVSDGGLPPDVPPLPVEVVYVPVGERDENLGLAALATRADADGVQLLAAVDNYGSAEQSALLNLDVDGTLFDARRVTVPPGATRHVTWQLPADLSVVSAYLTDQDNDFLALDDRAWAVHQGGARSRVQVITDGNLFLEQVYALLPGVDAFVTRPSEDAAAADFDLLVYDGVPLPDPRPDADLLIINPPVSNALFEVTGVFSDTVATRLADDPLLRFVDWSDVNVRRAQAIRAGWGQALVSAESGFPLLHVGQRDGRRIAILTFDLRDSDLPLQIAFPILMANLTDWLNPGRVVTGATGARPGEPVAIAPGAGTTELTVERPDGSRWTVDTSGDGVTYADTGQLGLYRVTLRDATGPRPAGQFAVNLFAAAESAVAPRPSVQIGITTVTAAGEENVGQYELWPWLAALALLVLVVEWWLFHRGAVRPRPARPAWLRRPGS